MATLPTNRQAAEANLAEAKFALGSIPRGVVRTDEMVAHAAKAQALATMAAAQALLDIGDVLREGFTRSDFDVEVD